MVAPHFRAGVVLVVSRPDGDVLAFERADRPGAWQLPQGGLEPGEAPLDAAWRELAEETGLGPDQVRLVGEHACWTVSEVPPSWRKGERLGQAHRWYFFEVVDDTVEPTPDGREFTAWRWADRGWLVDSVVAFRQDAYRHVLAPEAPAHE